MFKYFAVTANCGNDSLGKNAIDLIKNKLKDYQLGNQAHIDFVVINCQEANIKKTFSELNASISEYNIKYNTHYGVVNIASMDTKTKFNTILGGYGIATYVIFDQDKVGFERPSEPVLARRDPKASFGSGYNKGGLISDFTLLKNDESINVKSISGHLDSNNQVKRNRDFSIIQDNISGDEVHSFKNLIDIIPNIQLSGYDANTRNKLDNEGNVHNPWTEYDTSTAGLKQNPLGNFLYSNESTYKSDEGDVATRPSPSKKRAGEADGGSLDIIAIADGMQHRLKGIDFESAIKVDPNYSQTLRDHAVLISPALNYEVVDEFTKVKGQMAAMLFASAPKLSKNISEMKDSEENRAHLKNIYNLYLKKDGLLATELNLHAAKLNYINKASQQKNQDISKINEVLFPTKDRNKSWFLNHTLLNYESEKNSVEFKQAEMFDILKGNVNIEMLDSADLRAIPSLGTRIKNSDLAGLFNTDDDNYSDDDSDDDSPDKIDEVRPLSTKLNDVDLSAPVKKTTGFISGFFSRSRSDDTKISDEEKNNTKKPF